MENLDASSALQDDFLSDLQDVGMFSLAAAAGLVTPDGELAELKDLQGGWPGLGRGPALAPTMASTPVQRSSVPQPLLPPRLEREGFIAEELAAANAAVAACLQAATEALLAMQVARAKLAEHGPPRAAPAAHDVRAAAATAVPRAEPQQGAQPEQQAQQVQQPQQEQAQRQLRPRRGAAAVKREDERAEEWEEDHGEGLAIVGSPASASKRKRPPRGGSAGAGALSPQQPTKTPGKGLRHFSLKVCEKVEGAGRTTYNKVADELVKDLVEEAAAEGGVDVGSSSYDEKNIRRRVYDALNVLMAIGIIRKEKKEIVWGGWPQGLAANSSHLEEAERQKAAARVEQKAAQLEAMVAQLCSLSGLIHRNHDTPLTVLQSWQAAGLPTPNPLQLPFMLVQASGEADVDVVVAPDSRTAHLDFHSPFQIFDDEQVIRMLPLELSPTHLLELFGGRGDRGGGGAGGKDSGLGPSQGPTGSGDGSGGGGGKAAALGAGAVTAGATSAAPQQGGSAGAGRGGAAAPTAGPGHAWARQAGAAWGASVGPSVGWQHQQEHQQQQQQQQQQEQEAGQLPELRPSGAGQEAREVAV